MVDVVMEIIDVEESSEEVIDTDDEVLLFTEMVSTVDSKD